MPRRPWVTSLEVSQRLQEAGVPQAMQAGDWLYSPGKGITAPDAPFRSTPVLLTFARPTPRRYIRAFAAEEVLELLRPLGEITCVWLDFGPERQYHVTEKTSGIVTDATTLADAVAELYLALQARDRA
jgi:hypothetical protein